MARFLSLFFIVLFFHGAQHSVVADTATSPRQEQQQECKDTFTEMIDLKFIKDKIFTLQNNEKKTPDLFSSVFHEEDNAKEQSNGEEEGAGSIASMFQSVAKLLSFEESDDTIQQEASKTTLLENMLETARQMTSSSDKSRSFDEMWNLFTSAFTQVMDSVHRSMEVVWTSDSKFNVFSFWYYLEYEDERKNPSWKRRKHRYLKQVDVETVKELHNGLYLSQLSYADSVEDVRESLKGFMNNTWELVYCRVEGFPKEPAHFMAIHKEQKVTEGSNYFPWQKDKSTLDVMIVVRGTKEIGDLLSDGLLEAEDYRGGKAHAGIAQAGKFLVEKHIDTLTHLLEVSGRDKIRLKLAGHSLGAGAAAIAAIEYNEFPMIEATAIGFGCPALLSRDLAEQTKDYITTVVADSDVVPRMSAATVANMILDVLSYDFTSKALEDLKDFLKFVDSELLPLVDIPIEKILKLADEQMEKSDRPYFDKVTNERLPQVLHPPGTCIHVYRDGFGYSGAFTPCSFFDSVDVTRTLLDDHMIVPGYHRAFLNMLRDKLKDLHFDFQYDLMALPVQ